jgi:hypothetical protein
VKNAPQNRIDKSVLDNLQEVPSSKKSTAYGQPQKEVKQPEKKKDNCIIY